MRILELPDDAPPVERGRIHGEAFRHEIGSLVDLRVHLTRTIGQFPDDATVLGIAARHLPVLEHYHPDLYAELMGIADGSGRTPAEIVVLNHYTDLRDLDPAAPGDDGGCTAAFARTPSGPVLGQTWDMHASAIPFVMMLRVPSAGDQPGAWLFSLVGCLGMTGLNDAGVAVTINNLRSNDAKVGVVWPALVRGALLTRTAEGARDHILSAPVGSGHHYLVAGADGAFGIETSGRLRKVVYDGGADWFVHTDHCLDPEVASVSSVAPVSSTQARYDAISASLSERPLADAHDLWGRLGSTEGWPGAVCGYLATATEPHRSATCGAMVMDLSRGEALAAAGLIHHVRPEIFSLEASP